MGNKHVKSMLQLPRYITQQRTEIWLDNNNALQTCIMSLDQLNDSTQNARVSWKIPMKINMRAEFHNTCKYQ